MAFDDSSSPAISLLQSARNREVLALLHETKHLLNLSKFSLFDVEAGALGRTGRSRPGDLRTFPRNTGTYLPGDCRVCDSHTPCRNRRSVQGLPIHPGSTLTGPPRRWAAPASQSRLPISKMGQPKQPSPSTKPASDQGAPRQSLRILQEPARWSWPAACHWHSCRTQDEPSARTQPAKDVPSFASIER